MTFDPLVGGKPSWQTVSADGNGPTAGPARHDVSFRPGRYGQVGLFVVRARLHDRTPQSSREPSSSDETGAVRVRWDREQLIGGKPERLVSRALRVLVRVLDHR